MNSKLMLGVSVVVLAVIAGAVGSTFMGQGNSAGGTVSAQSAVNPEVADILKLRDGDVVLGNKDAPLTLVEYASLTCPHCASFANTVLPQIKKDWVETGKVKLIYRDFPLDRLALRGSVLTRCLPAERRYTFVEVLFRTQNQWAANGEAAFDNLARTAKLAGLSDEQINACVADTKNEEAVLQSRLEASQKLAVQATPTIFLNGRPVDHSTADTLIAALKAAQ
jgi:protein-disulfide isomerase